MQSGIHEGSKAEGRRDYQSKKHYMPNYMNAEWAKMSDAAKYAVPLFKLYNKCCFKNGVGN